MSEMKKVFIVVLILAAIATLGYMSGHLWAQGENAVIMLEVQGGQVQVKHTGAEFADVNGTIELKVGDTIKSFADSKSKIVFGDTTFVVVKPSTELEVKMNGFRIKQGKTWISFAKKGGAFEIITPTATVGIRGTELSVEITSAMEEIVSVISGLVSVKRGESEAIELKPGQMVSYKAEDTVNPMAVEVPAEVLTEFKKLIEDKLLPATKGDVNINELENGSTGLTAPGKKEDYNIDVLKVKPDEAKPKEEAPKTE
jgi:hypothetical protein